MNAARKRPFRIFVPRMAVIEFAVEAQSPEEACKIIQRELRSGKRTEADSVETAESTWANPANDGGEWLVMATKLEPGEIHTPIMGWNGTTMINSVVPSWQRAKRRTGTERKNN